ncbi:DNA-3-methyladenine glycosylase 2 family protein [Catellatospora bangladeshensis]|uniref:DNA-3-methyladenine glycosylase 2 family protein n=1 Tax=Catellatospora bangladeshensis TaxID=310355 RepID=UPI001EF3292B|nr:AlkA N-terminal domain-containing protein [Catellatospora bangladeshensis]
MDRYYRAVSSRDSRFDGVFWTGVTSTGIYCRPSCPAKTPKVENCRFFPSAAAAARSGFRACKRCAPDAVPGSAQWDSRADVTARAVRLIGDGVVDRGGVPELASRLGYTERHLHRLLTEELGAGPLALARTQRAQTAKTLIGKTGLSLSEIAFAAGFGSIRQFNDTFREVYGCAPSALRREDAPVDGTVSLKLSYRAPLHAASLFGFLAMRTIAGVDDFRDGRYTRALRLPHGPATATLWPEDGHVAALLHLSDVRDLTPAVARCRRLLDLDADPAAVDAVLGADPALSAAVTAEPGVRLPRSVDGFEMAVRAVVGQQISVSGARTVLARLCAAAAALDDAELGRPAPTRHPATGLDDRPGTRTAAERSGSFGETAGMSARLAAVSPKLQPGQGTMPGFPTPEQVLALPDEVFAMPGARRRTVRALAEAVRDGLRLDAGSDRAATREALLALPGVGPWTADYVALRALGDPDVLLTTDLGTRRGAKALGLPDDPAALARHAERWRPWRSYAQIRLWRAA